MAEAALAGRGREDLHELQRLRVARAGKAAELERRVSEQCREVERP